MPQGACKRCTAGGRAGRRKQGCSLGGYFFSAPEIKCIHSVSTLAMQCLVMGLKGEPVTVVHVLLTLWLAGSGSFHSWISWSCLCCWTQTHAQSGTYWEVRQEIGLVPWSPVPTPSWSQPKLRPLRRLRNGVLGTWGSERGPPSCHWCA